MKLGFQRCSSETKGEGGVDQGDAIPMAVAATDEDHEWRRNTTTTVTILELHSRRLDNEIEDNG